MTRIILFCLIIVNAASVGTAATSDSNVTPYIVGGDPITPNEYPWMVALVRDEMATMSERQFCGGVLIHPLWILTAAHCVSDYNYGTFTVWVGSGSLLEGEHHYPAAIFLHPEVDIKRIDRGCDLALIRLRDPVEGAEPIPLLRAVTTLTSGTSARAIGWGATEYDSSEDTTTDDLMEVDLIIQEMREVEEALGFPENDPVSDYFIATNDSNPIRGTANGDSGGPLLVEQADGNGYAVAGVVSFGIHVPELNIYTAFYTSVPAAAEWIDSMVNNPGWTKPEISNFDRIEPEFDENRQFRGGYRFWPFEDGIEEIILPVYGSESEEGVALDFSDPNFRYNPDGSVTFLHVPQFQDARYADEATSLVRIYPSERTSVQNAPMVLHPFQRTEMRISTAERSFGKTGAYFKLEGLEPGRDYELTGASRAQRVRLFETREDSNTLLGDFPDFTDIDVRFTALENANYWIETETIPNEINPISIGFRPFSEAEFNGNETFHGTLSESSPLYKNQYTRAEQVAYTGNLTEEVKLNVYSDFDAEITLYEKKRQSLNGYYDVEIEGLTEEFIVSANDLQRGLITIHNFDKDVFGNFSLDVEPHTTYAVTIGETQQRAITRHDDSYYESGETVYYEWFTVRAPSNENYIRIEIVGRYFAPAVAVYDGTTLVESVYDGEYVNFEFRGTAGKRYTIEVYDFEGPQNANFEVTVTTSSTATLSEKKDPYPNPFHRKDTKNLVSIHKGRLSQKEVDSRIQNFMKLRAATDLPTND